jgi:DNA-binding transcriptional ArsR family regulator
MDGDADIAAVGALLADRSRCRVLAALGDGRALPATVLASEAGVAASTASEHLGRLVDAGLLVAERHGRHRYFRISGPDVADLLEAMARLAPPLPVRSLREGTRAEALRFARTCYDHLAGRVGVEVMDALLANGYLEPGPPGRDAGADRLSAPGRALRYGLTDAGWAFLEGLGIDLDHLPPRREAIRYCMDWSEQRPHLAGAVGAAIASWFLDNGWIERTATRAVRVTEAGRRGFEGTFGVDAVRDRAMAATGS